jgi:hypothetical protein
VKARFAVEEAVRRDRGDVRGSRDVSSVFELGEIAPLKDLDFNGWAAR